MKTGNEMFGRNKTKLIPNVLMRNLASTAREGQTLREYTVDDSGRSYVSAVNFPFFVKFGEFLWDLRCF